MRGNVGLEGMNWVTQCIPCRHLRRVSRLVKRRYWCVPEITNIDANDRLNANLTLTFNHPATRAVWCTMWLWGASRGLRKDQWATCSYTIAISHGGRAAFDINVASVDDVLLKSKAKDRGRRGLD